MITSKDFKRVVASHSQTFKEIETKILKDQKNKSKGSKSEKSKLGDIKELVNLKEKLDGED